MANAFKDRTNFNEDIGGWDVSNVTNMIAMFRSATLFNQPIGNWDVSNVTHFTDAMFMGASAFNQALENGMSPRVASMQWMFRSEASIRPIGDWDTPIGQMHGMFFDHYFNRAIGSWDV